VKFTIERKTLFRMVEFIREKMPGRKRGDAPLNLRACAARVFVATCDGCCVLGCETLVLEDGECVVPGRLFSRILKSYGGQKILAIEADETGLRIGGFSMPVKDYSPTGIPPADFQVFSVTDLGVLGSQPEAPAQHERSRGTTNDRPPRI